MSQVRFLLGALMRLGVTAALVGSERVAGDVAVGDGVVRAAGLPVGRGARGIAVPGLVDLQVNGVGDVDLFADVRAVDGLAAHGVTACRPTFVSAPEPMVADALRALAGTRTRVRTLGAHLEGPFLSPRWPGAHDPAHLRAPDPALLERLLAAGPVSAVTLAPELPGALGLVEALSARGVVVQVGHTDADAATCAAAFARGARALTHAGNAHRRFAPRDPGPLGAAVAADDVVVTAIADGVHLADETLLLLARACGARLCLVSDLAAPTLAGARPPAGVLAGSRAGLDAGLRRLVALGLPLSGAVHACSRAPALLVGRPDLGRLAPGAPADVAVLDDALEPLRTLVAGVEAWSR